MKHNTIKMVREKANGVIIEHFPDYELAERLDRQLRSGQPATFFSDDSPEAQAVAVVTEDGYWWDEYARRECCEP